MDLFGPVAGQLYFFVEEIKAHILWSVTFFPENRTIYEVKSKTMVEPERP
jgi:hypothetical protein